MRRWNGWGNDTTHYPLPGVALPYLQGLVGPGHVFPDASLEEVITCLPATRLVKQPFFTTWALDRLLHARGQSLPDWIELRSGRISSFPDAVAYPESTAQVEELLRYAHSAGVRVIPYGGGTSVVGHINPLPGKTPVMTVDLSRLNQLLHLDEHSLLATFQSGVRGPELESSLRQRGYVLGHYPQSHELSTLGGWVATRSCGQQSYGYGRIEELFAGGRMLTFLGEMELPNLPASAAGPDLRQLVLGSEGRLGILTEATVRIQPIPEQEEFYAAFFPDWLSGAEGLRAIAQQKLPLSMLRLSDETETETTLVLSGKEQLAAVARRGLSVLGYGPDRCLLIYAVSASRRTAARIRREAEAVMRAHRGLPTGKMIGRTWQRNRFLAPYLRNTLWDAGYALDTLETALPWSSVMPAARDIQSALRYALQDQDERVLVFTHLSHVYPDGASIYTTYLFRRQAQPERTLANWQALKSAASQRIVAWKGTISHQHGVGADHVSYLGAEKGAAGLRALQAVCTAFDPSGLLNPGKLLPNDQPAVGAKEAA